MLLSAETWREAEAAAMNGVQVYKTRRQARAECANSDIAR